jgi:N-acetylglucosamine kinase-like BadF-type ATPase
MILIADSGSTKTSWMIIDKTHRRLTITSGINPQLLNEDQIMDIIIEELIPGLEQDIPYKIYFYGAGCSSDKNIIKVSSCLLKYFPESDILIGNDLTGAARALFKQEKGIACIIGTGSNSGVYDGRNIIKNIPALGYILGDEGGGAYIGKLFIRDFLYGICPEKILKDFRDKFNYTKQSVLDKVYQQSRANVFLASIADYVSQNHQDEYCYNLIYTAFNDFFNFHLLNYPELVDHQIGVVGSIGFINQAIFTEVVASYGYKISGFLKSPIEDLAEYHVNLMWE